MKAALETFLGKCALRTLLAFGALGFVLWLAGLADTWVKNELEGT